MIEAAFTGDFGNRSRDQGCEQAAGDFLMFCDDDDVFAPDALAVVRHRVARQRRRVHLFRMVGEHDGLLWREPVVLCGNVGSPMFVVPNVKAKLGRWENDQGPFSDFRFLTDTLARHDTAPVFHEEVIAFVRPPP